MTAPGRKPTPLEQRIREGNPQNRPLPEPISFAGTLARPDGLPRFAAELWDEIVVQLAHAGVAQTVDRAALEALCVQWHRGRVAREILAVEGYFATGSTGQLVEHPALGIEREAHRLFLRFASEYGLTAAARARIVAAVRGRGGDQDELSGVLELEAVPLDDPDEE